MLEKAKNKQTKPKKTSLFLCVKILFLTLLFVFIPVSLRIDFQPVQITQAGALSFSDIISYFSKINDQAVDTISTSNGGNVDAKGNLDTYSDGPGFWKGLIFKLVELIIRSLFFVIYAFLWVIYSLLYSVVSVAEWILGLIFDPEFVKSMGGFTQSDFVKKTASLVSNICNIVYLFVLLYIAILSMIGRAETGRWLKKLIIAALLTNFSLVLAGTIIDFSQILMYSFPMGEENSTSEGKNKEIKFTIGTQILDNLQKNILGNGVSAVVGNSNFITDQLKNLPDALPSEDSNSFWTVAGAIFLFKMSISEALSRILHLTELIVFAAALMVTLITISSILVIRIGMLWILLILSPAAFLMYSFPPTERYFGMWISNLVRYAITGPILIFFLFMSKKVSEFVGETNNGSGLSKYLSGKAITDTASMKDDLLAFVSKNFQITFQFFIVLIFMWAGIIIANKFEVFGSANIKNLMSRTRRWSKKGLALGSLGVGVLGKAANGSKIATWTGFDWASKLRGNKLSKLNASLGEKQAQLAGMDPGSKEYTELSEEVEEQKSQKEALEGKMKRSYERKNRVMKAFALTSPALLKKKFSQYLENRDNKYHADVATNLNDFTNYWLNRGKSVQLQTANAQRQSHELEKEIMDLQGKLRISKDPKEIASIKNKIETYVKKLLELSVSDEEKRKSLLPQLMEEIAVNSNPDIIKEFLVNNSAINGSTMLNNTDRGRVAFIVDSIQDAVQKGDATTYKTELDNLKQELNRIKVKDPSLALDNFVIEAEKMIDESYKAKFIPPNKPVSIRNRFASGIPAIAKENALAYLSGSKIKDETAKKVKEKMEEFKKDPMLNKDLLAKKFAREELDPIEKEAVVRFFSSSTKDMSTLARNINKETGKPEGDIKNVISFIGKQTSEFLAMTALNNVQSDAEKSKNLSLIGHTIFDSISSSYRPTTEEERTQALTRSLSGMSDKAKLSKITPTVFKYDNKTNAFVDPLAVETTVKSINFNKIQGDGRLAKDIAGELSSSLKTNLVDNQTQFENIIQDQVQKDALSNFINDRLK